MALQGGFREPKKAPGNPRLEPKWMFFCVARPSTQPATGTCTHGLANRCNDMSNTVLPGSVALLMHQAPTCRSHCSVGSSNNGVQCSRELYPCVCCFRQLGRFGSIAQPTTMSRRQQLIDMLQECKTHKKDLTKTLKAAKRVVMESRERLGIVQSFQKQVLINLLLHIWVGGQLARRLQYIWRIKFGRLGRQAYMPPELRRRRVQMAKPKTLRWTSFGPKN